MKLPSYVKVKPKILEYLPWISLQHGSTVGHTIYLKKEIYDDLLTAHPKPKNLAYLAHEQTHIKRIQTLGLFHFGWYYLFSRPFRFHEELRAIKEQMKVLKKNNLPFNINGAAKFLSGWVYLWSVPYTLAKQELEKAWAEV